ncbi:MAG: hypothetical protein ACTSSB_16905 [Candidatus Heimdallarchaeota archaeon]
MAVLNTQKILAREDQVLKTKRKTFCTFIVLKNIKELIATVVKMINAVSKE